MEVSFNELDMGKVIGQGTFSFVNKARHKKTGQLYAVKIFNIYNDYQGKQFFKEVSSFCSIQDCDALISLKGAFHHDGRIGMIIEYMDEGSIEFVVHEEISEEAMAAIFFQIIWGLGYLHCDNRLHRDMKPGNVLLVSGVCCGVFC